jgi:hypothetical protein
MAAGPPEPHTVKFSDSAKETSDDRLYTGTGLNARATGLFDWRPAMRCTPMAEILCWVCSTVVHVGLSASRTILSSSPTALPSPSSSGRQGRLAPLLPLARGDAALLGQPRGQMGRGLRVPCWRRAAALGSRRVGGAMAPNVFPLMPSTLGAQTPVLWHRHPDGARVGHSADTAPVYLLQSVCP